MPIVRARRVLSFASAVLAVWTAGCDGGGSPTRPAPDRLTLTSAAVSVDGVVYNGGTFDHEEGHGESTRFEARLMVDGTPAPGERVWVSHGRGMMGGRFPLFDDGTHGDPVAGDGLYCLEDFEGDYGFHHAIAPHGTYRYDFWGQHHDGGESNHLEVVIEVEG